MRKEKEDNLIGKLVSLYLVGGWEVSGLVKSISDGKIVLEQQGTGDLFLAFRDKVSCLHVSVETPAKSPLDPRPKKNVNNEYSEFPMNKIAYDDSGMSIPQGLLKDLPAQDDDDFSVTFESASESKADVKNGGIEFRLQNDTTKED